MSHAATAARKAFAYDDATGRIVRGETRGGQLAGTVVGTLRRDGYLSCRFNGREILLHRLAWLLHYGEPPANEIDHINGDRTDNRIANLRLVDRATNNQNRRKAHANNKLGVLGVSQVATGVYTARIRVNKRLILLGRFLSIDHASAAYLRAKRQLHGGNTL